MKKFWVLFSLFILPLVFYLFLLTGTNNFAKLPVLTKGLEDIPQLGVKNSNEVSLENKITVLCFFGDDLEKSKNNAFNLNEKIYKHFYKFRDFQFVVVLPNGTEDQAKALKEELGVITDMQKWNFVFADNMTIKNFFNTLQTNYTLDLHSYSPYAFIIDKDMNLRGRTDDEDTPNGIMYGYNAETVAPVHSKMVDDVKVLVAEYRLALKKNKREI